MASGLSVAIPELVAANVPGYVVPWHDIENLARRAIVEAEYNIHHLNDQLERYYRELAGS